MNKSLNFVPKGPIDNIPALVQIIADMVTSVASATADMVLT